MFSVLIYVLVTINNIIIIVIINNNLFNQIWTKIKLTHPEKNLSTYNSYYDCSENETKMTEPHYIILFNTIIIEI